MEPWIINVIVVVSIAAAGFLINFFRLRAKKTRKNELLAKSNAAEIKLLKKVLIIALKKIDKQTAKAHGEDPEIACLVKDLLSDNIDGRK